MVTVSSADVLEQDYEVIQQDVSGNFKFSQVDVGFRSDATHELVFEDGFLFAKAHDDAVTSNAAVILGGGTLTGTYLVPNKATPVVIGQSAYGMLSTTGPIKSVVLTNGDAPTATALRGTAWDHGSIQTSFDETGTDPTADTDGVDHVIRFEATAPGRATITVSYTIYVADNQVAPADPDSNLDAMTVSRTLTLNIQPVLES